MGELMHNSEQKKQYCRLVMQGKYELGRVLGHGTFARVYFARNVATGKPVAMKVIGKEKVIKAKMMNQMKREISVMKRLKHPNIVELFEVMATKSKIFLAMELVRGGELHGKVSKEGKLEESIARGYFQQLISAVDYCHSRGVFHRDLKLENLLIDHEGNLKVTDFGLSASLYNDDDGGGSGGGGSGSEKVMLRTCCGTPHYVAPEVVNKKGQGYDGAKADIWSCGVILYVMLAGYLPFHDENIVQLYSKVNKGDFTYPSWVSPMARDLITRMLDPNPETRVSLVEVMASEWFKSNTKPLEEEEGESSGMILKEYTLEALNAFHIISMSEGLDLSPLFLEEKKKREEREEIGFTTMLCVNEAISRLQDIAARSCELFKVSKEEDSVVRIQGQEKGRKGKLVILVELFEVSSSFLMVEVKKEKGDTLEFNQFCLHHLRPALFDVVWTTSAEINTTIASSYNQPCAVLC